MLSWFIQRLILESNIDEKEITYYFNVNTHTGKGGVVQINAASKGSLRSGHKSLAVPMADAEYFVIDKLPER
uniref:Uncharacterized protein n=1 Tax=Glossina palpalis gambiensis TaxID=67801 RepID=A0A1B0AMF7_9MUSC